MTTVVRASIILDEAHLALMSSQYRPKMRLVQ
jgi:hypothetical protein